MNLGKKELPPSELIDAALAGTPIDLPVSYDHLAHRTGRGEVVVNRIAKNIGPLFGVPDPSGPLGEMSWLRDHASITLTEIARGAPEPTRTELEEASIDTSQKPTDWQRVGTVVYGKTPNAIAPGSVNTFGPDTKACIMLAGINRLLELQTQLLTQTLQSRDFERLTLDQKLQTYSGIFTGAYRPQPLLLLAGFFARNIQRSHGAMDATNIPRQRTDKREIYDLDIADQTAKHLAPRLDWRYPEQRPADKIARGLDDMVHHTEDAKYARRYDASTNRKTIILSSTANLMTQFFANHMRPYLIAE